MLKSKDELFDYLFFVLTQLECLVSKQSYQQFISYIADSLNFQQLESKYQLSIISKEADYFKLVNRSVFLMQSIVFLVDSAPSLPLLDAIKFIAISGQIDNDLADLGKDISYDLLDNKGIIPLIKTIEWAKEEKEKELIDNLLNLNRGNYTIPKVKAILNQINNCPSITYCHLLKLSFENESKKRLEEYGLEFIFDNLFNVKKRSDLHGNYEI